MDTVISILTDKVPCVAAVIVIVVAFLRHLSKHNEFLYTAIKDTTESMGRVAETLSKVEERIESVEDKVESIQRDVLKNRRP